MIAVGKTGCGKSTFLLNVVRQQVESGIFATMCDGELILGIDGAAFVPDVSGARPVLNSRQGIFYKLSVAGCYRIKSSFGKV